MNKHYLILVLIMIAIFSGICLIFAKQISQPENLILTDTRNSEGTLSFTIRTVTYNGPYAPNNAGAIWITNSNNQFVKTIKVWANSYKYTLVKWLASSGNNTVGAVTGASLTSHQLHTVSWNGTNSSNTQVTDGDYKINIEFAEHNASSSNPGKYKSITFSKSTSAIDQAPANESYFRDIHLVWSPATPTIGYISGLVTDDQNNPVNGAIITVGSQSSQTSTSGLYTIQLVPGTYNVTCEASGLIFQTQNNIVVVSNQTTTVNFNLAYVSNDEFIHTPLYANLKQNYPNPFNKSTEFQYYINKNSNVYLKIYNLKGQIVKTLINGKLITKGWNQVSWSGLNDRGDILPSGNYVCRLSSSGITINRILSIKR